MHWKKKRTKENRDGNPKSYLTFDNNDIEFLYSLWHLSWKGHILSVSIKISKSIGIIYKSSLCLLHVLFDYRRPFLTPLLNILCFSKSYNGFSSSGIARGGFQGFQNPPPFLPPPIWPMKLALFQAKKKKNSERHRVLYQRIQYHCYNEGQ